MQDMRRELEWPDNAAASLLGAEMPTLTEEERATLRQLPVVHRFVGRSHLLLKEGEAVARLQILCKGWAIRYRWLDDDRRQVLDFVLPGEFIGLHVDGNGASICDVMALTACEVGEVELGHLDRVAARCTGVASGFHQFLQRQLCQASDQIMRLGRMTAYERVCGFLLDIYARQSGSYSFNGTVDFPVTQAVIADLLGLSVVHVNRQIMRLRREGLVTLTRRSLTIHDEQRLIDIAGHRGRRPAPRQPITVAAE